MNVGTDHAHDRQVSGHALKGDVAISGLLDAINNGGRGLVANFHDSDTVINENKPLAHCAMRYVCFSCTRRGMEGLCDVASSDKPATRLGGMML